MGGEKDRVQRSQWRVKESVVRQRYRMEKSKRRADAEMDRGAERNLRGRKREEMKVAMERAGRTGFDASRDGVTIGIAFLSGIGRGIREEKGRSKGTAD